MHGIPPSCSETLDLTAQAGLAALAAAVGPTAFTGYSATRGAGRVRGLMRGGAPVEVVEAGGWGGGREG